MQLKLLRVKHQQKQEVVSQEVDSFTSISCFVPAAATVSVHAPQTEEATCITKQQWNKKVDISILFVTMLDVSSSLYFHTVYNMFDLLYTSILAFVPLLPNSCFMFTKLNNEVVNYSTLVFPCSICSLHHSVLVINAYLIIAQFTLKFCNEILMHWRLKFLAQVQLRVHSTSV